MNPRDKNILDTLYLLILLHRAKKNPLLKVPEDEQVKLFVTEEHLQMSGLTMPAFLNALDLLGNKGYALFISPFEKKTRDEIGRYQKSDDFSKIMASLATQNTKEMNLKLRETIAKEIPKIAPKDMVLDVEGLMDDEEITIENLLQGAHEELLKYTPDTVAIVTILPFRNIERLLEKMNSGMKFDEVQDSGIWYDADHYELHFCEKVISTASRGTPTHAHFVLKELFNSKSGKKAADYSDVVGFTDFKDKYVANKRYSDAMRHLVSKNPELVDVFRIFSDRIEIAETYASDVH